MAWDCVSCGRSNPDKSAETQSLLKPAVFSRTCRYCGTKLKPKRVMEEFLALADEHRFDIEAWIEQGSNLGIQTTIHKSGVCHALVVDWLKQEIEGSASDFVHPFLVVDGLLVHGGIIPKRYVDEQTAYHKEKTQLGANSHKLSEMIATHKKENAALVNRYKQILPELQKPVTPQNVDHITKLTTEAQGLNEKMKQLQAESSAFQEMVTKLQSTDPDLGGLKGNKLGNFTEVKIDSFQTLAKSLCMACNSAGKNAYFKVDLSSKSGSHTIGWMIGADFRFALMDPNTGLWRARSPGDPSKFLLALFKMTYGGIFKDDYVGGKLTIYKLSA
ncbi:YopT-type cysteine protease domain-containing protein [Vitiosangium sp. GDMCC 1.1324]|uniref:YopT-type cysteine protease domain-containing protein n=1 Tax=Vitiosangium sp. (strain GDMCC 1.1324) TaxID=2138576 RepID=UPI000D3CFBFF|nr:YopT-type cysteine protease domain-containing protein [Vitiosangium sp. GDMCC 1.1324]PTL85529.1 hypothetical protein DAT35_02070 [Vitiosangium sp. GDMCC 1.1324]